MCSAHLPVHNADTTALMTKRLAESGSVSALHMGNVGRARDGKVTAIASQQSLAAGAMRAACASELGPIAFIDA
jgi:hypothetical protein